MEYSEKDGLEFLSQELREFWTSGLVALHNDLIEGVVGRRDWKVCPLSYRFGNRGSVDRDSQGSTGNVFTVLWDAGIMKPDMVAKAVGKELRRRARFFDNHIIIRFGCKEDAQVFLGIFDEEERLSLQYPFTVLEGRQVFIVNGRSIKNKLRSIRRRVRKILESPDADVEGATRVVSVPSSKRGAINNVTGFIIEKVSKAIQRDKAILVSPHSGVIEWVADVLEGKFDPEQRVINTSVGVLPVTDSVNGRDVAGKLVIGELPFRLAASAARVISVEVEEGLPSFHNCTADDLWNAGAFFAEYVVEII